MYHTTLFLDNLLVSLITNRYSTLFLVFLFRYSHNSLILIRECIYRSPQFCFLGRLYHCKFDTGLRPSLQLLRFVLLFQPPRHTSILSVHLEKSVLIGGVLLGFSPFLEPHKFLVSFFGHVDNISFTALFYLTLL